MPFIMQDTVNTLSIGGSGFVSGAVARLALSRQDGAGGLAPRVAVQRRYTTERGLGGAEMSEGGGDFGLFLFDEVEKFGGGSRIDFGFGVGVDGFEVEIFGFDLVTGGFP